MSRLVIIGLILDLFGAVTIAIPATRAITWPGIEWIANAKAKRSGLETLFSNRKLNDGDEGFPEIFDILQEKDGPFETEHRPNMMDITGRMGQGTVVAVHYIENGTRKERDMSTFPAVLSNWIETDIEQVYLRIGILLLISGFLLQIIYQL
jgi:hypothetical protein